MCGLLSDTDCPFSLRDQQELLSDQDRRLNGGQRTIQGQKVRLTSRSKVDTFNILTDHLGPVIKTLRLQNNH